MKLNWVVLLRIPGRPHHSAVTNRIPTIFPVLGLPTTLVSRGLGDNARLRHGVVGTLCTVDEVGRMEAESTGPFM